MTSVNVTNVRGHAPRKQHITFRGVAGHANGREGRVTRVHVDQAVASEATVLHHLERTLPGQATAHARWRMVSAR